MDPEIREINWATNFLPKIDPPGKGKEILEAFTRSNPVEEHCLLVIQSVWEAVSSKMSSYDEWARFRNEHRAAFDTAAPSVNYDHMCLWFLERELKEIIKQHRYQRFQAGLPLLVPESSATGYASSDDIPQITWAEARIVSKQGTNATAQETEEQPAQAEGQQVLAIEHQAQEQPAQEEDTTMIEQQAQEHITIEEIPPVVKNVEEAEAIDSLEHQAQEEEQQAPEAGQAGPIPPSPSDSSLSVHSSDSVGNNEDHQGPTSSGLHIVQYTEPRDNVQAEQDFAQIGPRNVNFSSPQEDFYAVSELKSMKSFVTSLEPTVNMMMDDHMYMKYDSQIFRRAFYNNMDEVVTSINKVNKIFFSAQGHTKKREIDGEFISFGEDKKRLIGLENYQLDQDGAYYVETKSNLI
ncbi:hypothetical protein F511_23788 [Dorcoceras hygrometricum]|uniref:Uncharacterized protein n=1 Tax=Dorcoceras hygrometricum TaxID=472368 RepID=A0A2Z7D9U3_9LAMI|nr:hypothetical protein F511_23788 [Dorcoceras hygrometricum]